METNCPVSDIVSMPWRFLYKHIDVYILLTGHSLPDNTDNTDNTVAFARKCIISHYKTFIKQTIYVAHADVWMRE